MLFGASVGLGLYEQNPSVVQQFDDDTTYITLAPRNHWFLRIWRGYLRIKINASSHLNRATEHDWWVEEHLNGLTVPIGDPPFMASRVGSLATLIRPVSDRLFPDGDLATRTTNLVQITFVGWPYAAIGRIELIEPKLARSMPGTLIVWQALALDIGILWALCQVPLGAVALGQVLRRWRRRKRGVCVGCAYDVGELARCPECGTGRE